MSEKLKSRKLWIALLGFFSVFLAEVFGVQISGETIAGLVGIVAAYVTGQAVVDFRTVKSDADRYVAWLTAELEAVLAGKDGSETPANLDA